MVVAEFATRRRVRLNGTLAQASDDRLVIEVEQAYGNCPQYIQQRVLAAAPLSQADEDQARHGRTLSSEDIDLIRAADTFFLGTTNPERGSDASHRGGPPGFVRVDGDQLWWPDYPGNNLFNSFGVVCPTAAGGLCPSSSSAITYPQALPHAAQVRSGYAASALGGHLAHRPGRPHPGRSRLPGARRRPGDRPSPPPTHLASAQLHGWARLRPTGPAQPPVPHPRAVPGAPAAVQHLHGEPLPEGLDVVCGACCPHPAGPGSGHRTCCSAGCCLLHRGEGRGQGWASAHRQHLPACPSLWWLAKCCCWGVHHTAAAEATHPAAQGRAHPVSETQTPHPRAQHASDQRAPQVPSRWCLSLLPGKCGED